MAREARGALPNIDLKDDLRMVSRMEKAQEKQVEHGLRILEALKRDPLDVNALKEANVESSRMTNAGQKLEEVTVGLVDRLSQRFPNRADELAEAKGKIDKALSDKRDEVSLRDPEFVEPEQKTIALKQVVAESGLQDPKNKAELSKKLGLRDEMLGSIEEDSLIDIKLGAQAEFAALDKDFAEAMKQAEEDPRLADKALSIALARHTAGKVLEMVEDDIAKTTAEVVDKEVRQLMIENAKTMGNELLVKAGENWDKLVTSGAKLGNRVMTTGVRAVGFGMGGAGLVAALPGAVVVAVGSAMMLPGVGLGAGGVALERTAKASGNWLGKLLGERRGAREETRSGEIEVLEKEIKERQAKLDALRGKA